MNTLIRGRIIRQSLCIRWNSILSVRMVSGGSSTKENRAKSLDELPGPPSSRLLAFTLIWKTLVQNKNKDPFGKDFFQRQRRSIQKYGKIFKREGSVFTIVQVADPDAAREILHRINQTKYPHRTEEPVMQYYRETRKAIAGVFFGNGPHWYKHRSVISKRTLIPREVVEYLPVFNDISNEFLARVNSTRGPAGSEHENEVQHLENELFKWSFEGTAYLLFDRRFGCLQENINRNVELFLRSTDRFLATIVEVGFLPVWFYKMYKTKTYKEFVTNLDNMYHCANMFVGERINELERHDEFSSKEANDGERVDFFTFLLSSGKLGKEDLLASVIDVLFAGSDTTSNTMQWVLYMMSKHPQKQEILYDEVTSVLKPGESPTAQVIARMPYLRAWLKETLRLYPVVPFMVRKLPVNMDILGYDLPAGTTVNILTYYMGRDEANFEDPAQFKPERWLRNDKNERAEAIHGFASMPFGFGTRMCIGRRIAELELHLLIAKTAQQYFITCPYDDDVRPFMRATIIPDRPLRIRFIDRTAQ